MRGQNCRNLQVEIGRALKRLGAMFRRSRDGEKDFRGGDPALVAAAARLLQVSDFSFFHLAHTRWYGRDAGEKKIESAFSAYLLREEVPFWVRHLAREVAKRYSGDSLDPKDFGIDRPPPHRPGMAVKIACGAGLLLFYLLYFFILSGYVPAVHP